MTQNQRILSIAVGTVAILMIPLILAWHWTMFDFAFMGILIFGAGVAFEMVANRGGSLAYKVATGVGLITTFLLMWVNAAVGIIGDGPINSLYLAVPIVLFVGAGLARLKARGMARTMFATAAAQLSVPVVALAFFPNTDFSPGIWQVFVLNAIFALLFIGSGLLFLRAASSK